MCKRCGLSVVNNDAAILSNGDYVCTYCVAALLAIEASMHVAFEGCLVKLG